MRNNAKKKYDGPILVSRDQVISAFAIVDEVRLGDQTIGAIKDAFSTKATLHLADGENYTVTDVDEIFRVPNRKKNRLCSIRISCGFVDFSATIQLGGSLPERVGASMEVSAPPETSRKTMDRFTDTFGSEKDALFSFLSIKPIWLVLIALIAAHIALGLRIYDTLGVLDAGRKGQWLTLFNYLMIYWVFPGMAVQLALYWVLFGWLGSAVFLWEDGLVSYVKKKGILITLLAVIPIAVMGSLLANQLKL